MNALLRALTERYRCPADLLKVEVETELSNQAGYFRFGQGVVGYGRTANGRNDQQVSPVLSEISEQTKFHGSRVFLPFDPVEVIENLRLEKYPGIQDSWARQVGKSAYYRLRPHLPRPLREQIQRLQLRGWRDRLFPAWPVDFSVEGIYEQLLVLSMRASGLDRIPFIWFWPHGNTGCVIMTHDVEGPAGRDFCEELMELDESHGIKSAFQLVPEGNYSVTPNFIERVRGRGFEVGIQDLNHDGRLYDDHDEFLRRARLINRYAKEYGATGFRGGVLYRKPEWYDAFDLSFDMSIPNTARLDPQRGGCCTVFPYFIGKMVEIPVTTIQDYMLLHLLKERSIELWKIQIGQILRRNGLISFIVHPDYVIEEEMRTLYESLLIHLAKLKSTSQAWFSLPRDVDRWWRQRSQMQLVNDGREWRIEGEGAERAVIAYARSTDTGLTYEFETALSHSGSQ
jgi:hypothetical protein